MHTGKQLGAALASAMSAKKITQRQLALEFNVQQPSVSEWLKSGRIHKKHLVHLVEFFSSHVDAQHWGLPANWNASPQPDSTAANALRLAQLYESLPPPKQRTLMAVAQALASSPHEATDWKD